MTPVSARTPAGRDDAPARERRPLVGTAARSAAKGVSPSSGMTGVSALTPAGKDGALAREPPPGELGRPPVGTAARSAAKGVYHAAVRMRLNAGSRPRGEPPLNSGSLLPPACGGLCRAPPGGLPRGRRSRACRSLCMVAWGPSLAPSKELRACAGTVAARPLYRARHWTNSLSASARVRPSSVFCPPGEKASVVRIAGERRRGSGV